MADPQQALMRLPRPHIPLEVRCRVILRQLGEMFPEPLIQEARDLSDPTVNPKYRRGFGRLLAEKLEVYAALLNCNSGDLHLDHDPALAVRLKLIEEANGCTSRSVYVPKGARVLRYYPDANDHEHLFYRPKALHDVKTRVRGLRGQMSDLLLMKKLRKLDRKRLGLKKPSRKIRSASRWASGRKFR